MRLVLPLTAEQRAEIEPHMRAGVVLLGRVMREPFNAELGNGATSGRLLIELGSVPESCLPALRTAIVKANK